MHTYIINCILINITIGTIKFIILLILNNSNNNNNVF